MLLNRRGQTSQDETIDMAPMVDVVFQLMAFLLLSFQLKGLPPVDIPESRNGIGIDQAEAVVVVLVPPDQPLGEASAFVDEEASTPATLEDLQDYLAVQVALGRTQVVIQADGEVPFGEVIRWASAMGEVEGVSTNFGVREPGT